MSESCPAKKTLDELLAVMAALRTPGTGCPWDLEQTFKTIAPYTIEEAYEVADAIEREALGDLKEELGDLLLQVVYHARIAEELGAFTFDDVADAITRKMIRRHPHVFGPPEARRAGAEPGFWARIKAEEKAEKESTNGPKLGQVGGDQAQDGQAQGLLDDVPVTLPALTRAIKLQNRAATVGFDWPSLQPVFAKLNEELAELVEAIEGAKPGEGAEASGRLGRSRIEEEFGDLLFVVANVARHLAIDPEASLRAANQKFMRRFRRIEALLAERGRTPHESNLEEMDRLWDQAKREEHAAVRGPA